MPALARTCLADDRIDIFTNRVLVLLVAALGNHADAPGQVLDQLLALRGNDVGDDLASDRCLVLDFPLDIIEGANHDAIGYLVDEGVEIELEEAVDARIGQVDHAHLLQADQQRNDTQQAEHAQRADRDAADQVVPAHERVEVPARVDTLADRHDPLETEFQKEDRHEDQVVEQEVLMNMLAVEATKGRCHSLQDLLHRNGGIERIEHDE